MFLTMLMMLMMMLKMLWLMILRMFVGDDTEDDDVDRGEITRDSSLRKPPLTVLGGPSSTTIELPSSYTL